MLQLSQIRQKCCIDCAIKICDYNQIYIFFHSHKRYYYWYTYYYTLIGGRNSIEDVIPFRSMIAEDNRLLNNNNITIIDTKQ